MPISPKDLSLGRVRASLVGLCLPTPGKPTLRRPPAAIALRSPSGSGVELSFPSAAAAYLAKCTSLACAVRFEFVRDGDAASDVAEPECSFPDPNRRLRRPSASARFSSLSGNATDAQHQWFPRRGSDLFDEVADADSARRVGELSRRSQLLGLGAGLVYYLLIALLVLLVLMLIAKRFLHAGYRLAARYTT